MQITQEQETKLIEAISKRYGDVDEDWGGRIVKVRGVEKLYAVKCPTSAQWFDFQNKANLYFTKLNEQAKSVKPVQGKGLQETMINLIADCLISDVEGVATHEEFCEDYLVKVKLVDSLIEVITGLAESGVRSLKKE